MSAAQAKLLDDLSSPLRRCVQQLEASCRNRQDALFEEYTETRSKFLDQHPNADFEATLTAQARETLAHALPEYSEGVDAQAQAFLQSVYKSHWALQRADLQRHFDSSVVRSRRFLAELLKFSEATIAGEAIPFATAYTAIQEAQSDRTSRTTHRKGLDSKKQWQVSDVKEAMMKSKAFVRPYAKRKKLGADIEDETDMDDTGNTAEPDGEPQTNHAGDRQNHQLLAVVVPNVTTRKLRNLRLSRNKRPSPSLASRVLQVASRTSKRRKSQTIMVPNESSSRSPSIERGRGGAHDLSDHNYSFDEVGDDEEEGAASGDEDEVEDRQDDGPETEQHGDEDGQDDGPDIEEDGDESARCVDDHRDFNHTTDDNDPPPSCELEKGPFCEQGQSSVNTDHNASSPSDTHLDPGLDPTLPFQLSCPTALQPIKSQNLKAFDAYIQAEFRALYCNIAGELQSRLSQQGLLIAQTNKCKKSLEADIAQIRQSLSKSKKRRKGLEKTMNKTKRQLDELDESDHIGGSESDKENWSAESDKEVAGLHDNIKAEMQKYHKLLEERTAGLAQKLVDGEARLLEIEAQALVAHKACEAHTAELDEWKAYNVTWPNSVVSMLGLHRALRRLASP